ncbi:MAG TPA: alpha/beta hydrolase [Pseudonocardiaceae bacterium]|jgi:pimeloyl-ACP methyl ester carboxylesterase|nr:alpha/beta hydrolase [Pseudonocardiaceae bacterium]
MSRQPITFTECWAARGPHRIRVRDYPGDGPAIVLMHGFPDDKHLYDRTLPYLTGRRRVVTFDFLGWGESDKPPGYPYTAANQTGDLDAVITRLELDQVVLVAHDASGPPAIDWALQHPERVAALVLLNTYYGWMPRLRPPEAIILYASPILRNLARPVMRRLAGLDRRLYFWQVGRFIRDEAVRRDLLPQYYTRFRAARPAFLRLNADLPRTLISRARRTSQLRAFERPVRIVFGSDDPYLNTRVARRFARLFPAAELELIDGARHYVQVDEPEVVAVAILNSDRVPSPG